MSEKDDDKARVDPFSSMMSFYDAWTKAWANTMTEAVANERFVETMAEQMEAGLEVMSVVRRQVNEAMEQYLQQMNLPTRQEVVRLGERLTRIEMTVDDVNAKLDEILDHLKAIQEA